LKSFFFITATFSNTIPASFSPCYFDILIHPINIRPDVLLLLRLIAIRQGYAKRLSSRRRSFPLNARM